jgi:hypothetical protein
MRPRIALLAIALFGVLSAMLMTAVPPPVRVQAQDPTLLYLDGLKKQRESELAAEAARQREKQATARAQATATQQSINATGTAVILDITVAAATQQYWDGKTTQTPLALTAVAGQATATWKAQATGTANAQATGTANATATQIAGTATATAAIATADAEAFAERIRRKAEEDRLTAEARQRTINQVRQIVYVLGGLVLTVLAGGLTCFSLRWIWAWVKAHLPQARPVQVVEVVKEPEERHLTPEEVQQDVDEMPLDNIRVTTDVNVTEIMYEHLRREGVAPSETAA